MEDEKACPFCVESVKGLIIEKKGTVIAIRDGYPSQPMDTQGNRRISAIHYAP